MLTVNEMCFVSKYIIENNNLYMVQVNLIISLHGPLHPHQLKILHMFNSSYKESHVKKKKRKLKSTHTKRKKKNEARSSGGGQ